MSFEQKLPLMAVFDDEFDGDVMSDDEDGDFEGVPDLLDSFFGDVGEFIDIFDEGFEQEGGFESGDAVLVNGQEYVIEQREDKQ